MPEGAARTGREPSVLKERCLRAIAAWQRAEEVAHAAASIAARQRQAARLARRHASERRERAADAFAARQLAFARGLAEAAEAHERAADDADRSALEAERRARPLRLEAEARLHAVARLVRGR